MGHTTSSKKQGKATSPFRSTEGRSGRSTSAKRSGSQVNPERPFDPATLARAKAIADRYQIILHHEDGEYYGRGLEMPTVMNHGRTPDGCVKATREILTSTVAHMLETGQTPPPPASEAQRTEQINIRVTLEERLFLEQAARTRGFRGISDYVRSASLSRVS